MSNTSYTHPVTAVPVMAVPVTAVPVMAVPSQTQASAPPATVYQVAGLRWAQVQLQPQER